MWILTLLQKWRWWLIGALFASSVLGSAVGAWRWRGSLCEVAASQVREANNRELMRQAEKTAAASAELERKLAKQRVKTVEVIREVERIVERPVYRCAVDADGLRILRESRGQTAPASKPDDSVPGPSPVR